MRRTLSLSASPSSRRCLGLYVQQLQTLHFAGGPFGQGRNEAQLTRRFVASKMSLAILAQLCRVAMCAGLEHHTGENVLAVKLVGDSDRGGFQHGRVPEQRFVDLARGDVLAALDDQLLQT